MNDSWPVSQHSRTNILQIIVRLENITGRQLLLALENNVRSHLKRISCTRLDIIFLIITH